MSLINSFIWWAAVHNGGAHPLAGTKKSALIQMEKLQHAGLIHPEAELMLIRLESHTASKNELESRIKAEAVLEKVQSKQNNEVN
ncbi:hypothetical protein F907_00815 [Acinetobacter colistiniresistens]|uniref:Uncharacterized protein n=1 Tax=Acinetobacter colistiniresistens TaxID=280145 RepID=S3UJ13_9GAMM|nr:hypothetical protein [Acinetobacter colistiniresistens]EPG39512.1 hypothetical protein F907_00815 [Acinetobacter colistiniresistens]